VALSQQLYTAAENGNTSTVKTLLATPGIMIDYQNAVGFIHQSLCVDVGFD
jgi:hypothetical protein